MQRSTAGRLLRPRYFGGGAADAVLPTRDTFVAWPNAAVLQPGTPKIHELFGLMLLSSTARIM
jgi:hypothetical protein